MKVIFSDFKIAKNLKTLSKENIGRQCWDLATDRQLIFIKSG